MRALTLMSHTFLWIGRGALRRHRRQFVEQLFEMGNRSLLFITVMLGTLGMISVFQVLIQVDRIFLNIRW